ncbi:hypothetical protein F0U60_26010 [Archangium minus]|uniref:DUF4116 domain-containing protein n=1 Tax=Archangium minus TaxID=83450 RepID=A0ABY9WW15_9BACT|nr:hypothetical protein F0U60_26010 [Archangium minus]
MNRLEHLRGVHAAALLREFLAREHGPERSWAAGGEAALFARFAEADPTAGKPHLEWVLRLYLSGRLRAEDLYKVPETLQVFRRVRRRLPECARELNSYEDLPSLWRTVAPHAQAPSKRARAAEEREKARAESRVLYEDEELIVAVPLTQASAQWWGRGTRWCTAAEENNAFEAYNRQGPLVVFITNGVKFQFHAPSDSFHDDADGPVDVGVLGPFLPRLEAAGLESLVLALDPLAQEVGTLPAERLRSAITEWGMPLCFVPEERRDAELCRLALTRDGESLFFVPEPLRTRELCALAVASDGRSLQYVPFSLRDRELCLSAIENGASLADVPDTCRDRDMCLAAAKRGGSVLEFVPFALRDAELCRQAMASGPDRLEHTPWELRDRDTCFRALESDGYQIAFAPERHRDRELYLGAIQRRGCTLEFVPLAMRDLELCVEAVRSEKHAWRFTTPELRPAIAAATGVDLDDEQVRAMLGGLALLPHAERTRERCLEAAREKKFEAGLAPDVLRDHETCRELATRMFLLEYIPEDFRSREVCLANVARDPYGLASVPEGLRDREMCLAGVRGYGEQLRFVADPLRDEEMCRVAIASEGDALVYVPFALRERALCLEAVRERKTPSNYLRGELRDVPDTWRDEEMCRAAISGGNRWNGSRLLEHIPFSLREAKLCREVVSLSPAALVHVPHALRDASLCAIAVSAEAHLRRHVPAALREALPRPVK